LPVAATIEVAVGLAAGGGDGRDAAQHGECGLGAEPVVVFADGDQELAGDVGADPLAATRLGQMAATRGSRSSSRSAISVVSC